MPVTLKTVQAKVDTAVRNRTNAKLIHDFDAFMDHNLASESYRKNNLKAVTYFTAWLSKTSKSKTLLSIKDQEDILNFLKQYRGSPDEEAWKTTYNDYLNRLKHFFRWLHNVKIPGKRPDEVPIEDWKTPEFCKIKKMRTKRKSTYAINETWKREEVLVILPYEPLARNKAAIAMLWDMDGRNHELCKMMNKHVQYFQKHARAEIPSNTKTGGGPVLLRMSFPYLLAWKNEHPFKDDPNAPLLCNMKGGEALGDSLDPDYLWKITNNLRKSIKAMLAAGKIKDEKETQRLEYLLKTKKWNPYCFRHSAIRHDATYLPSYALTQKVRWVPNSKQAGRYMAMTLSEEVERTILAHDGIITEETEPAPLNRICSRCETVNALEFRQCQKCGYALTRQALEEQMVEESNLKEEVAQLKETVTKNNQEMLATFMQMWAQYVAPVKGKELLIGKMPLLTPCQSTVTGAEIKKAGG